MDAIPDTLPSASPLLGLIEKCEQILTQHREANPDLYRLVDLNREQDTSASSDPATARMIEAVDIIMPTNKHPFASATPLRGSELKAKMRESHQEIRQRILAVNADIVPRTQAHNRKNTCGSIEEERDSRADIMQAQIRTWRNLLPPLIRRFSKLSDYRNVSYGYSPKAKHLPII